MNRIIIQVILTMAALTASAQTWSGPFQWRLRAEASGGHVVASNAFIKGDNFLGRRISSTAAGAVKADFSYNPASAKGMLYPDLYQGLGIRVNSFMSQSLLGTPVSVFAYQGAPIVKLGPRFSVGYEWEFGAAIGWHRYSVDDTGGYGPVSTPVTAHMQLGARISYRAASSWEMSAGVAFTHFSNGNTSIPNAGLNSFTGSIGVAYLFGARETPAPVLDTPLWSPRWVYDIVAYGAWRKRIVTLPDIDPQLCPGKFGIAGLQISPLRQFNQWFAAGPAMSVQYDESAGLAPYWVEGTSGDGLLFFRPPFGKQLTVGVSAHAELTTPIFAINAGIGYSFLCPYDDKRFYQSLTIKAFVSRHIFINVGYRLGRFQDPQNLMLGMGVRIRN